MIAATLTNASALPDIAGPLSVEVTLNGQPHTLPTGATVASLVAGLGINPRHVAVELNLEVVPRGRHAEQPLAEGDRLEVVTLVGGG